MPAKNSVKDYFPDSYYHLYNRGVEKREIFLDQQDFGVFLKYLRQYLSPKDEVALKQILDSTESSHKERDTARKLLRLNNFSKELDLLCFALLPNHFHFIVKQTLANTIDQFINSLCTRYTMYFNKKYHRVGRLYQDVYKAVRVESEEQLLHLSRYINLNPMKWLAMPLKNYKQINFPSSLNYFVENKSTSWLKTEEILSYFSINSPKTSYYNFLEAYAPPEFVLPVSLDYADQE